MLKLLIILLLTVAIPAQMQNSPVATLLVEHNDATAPYITIQGQPGQYYELWGMMGGLWYGAELTPWGVVDIPIFFNTHIMLWSGFLSYGSTGGESKFYLNIPPGGPFTFSIQAIVGVNDPWYPIWWITQAWTITSL